MSEAEVQEKVQKEAMKLGCQLWRNNVGAFMDTARRLVRFGLGHISKEQNKISKSSDLIGGLELVITPNMVGKKIFIFTAIECKDDSKPIVKDERYHAQKNYIELVKLRGGVAGFAQSVKDLTNIIKEFKKSLSN